MAIRSFLVVVQATVFLLTLGRSPALAISNGEYVAKVAASNCADGPKLVELEKAADEDDAVNDDAAHTKWKNAARLAYRCSESTSGSLARDWYRFIYAKDLVTASTDPEELRLNLRSAVTTLQDLNDHSAFSEVRKAAHSTLGFVRKDFAKFL